MLKRFAIAAGMLLAFHVSSATAGPCDHDVQANQEKAERTVQDAKADVAAKPARTTLLVKQAKVEAATEPAKLEPLVQPAKADAAAEAAKTEEPVKQAKVEAAVEQVKVEATAKRRGGGNRRGLTPAMLALLDRIESKFGPVNVISGYRPGARIATTGRISRHASGNAADIDAGSRKGAIVKWLIANHHNGGTMTYSDMGHIHVDIGQHFVSLGAYSGRTGHRYARSRYRDAARYSDAGYSRRYANQRRSRERSPGSYARSYAARHFASGYAAIY